MVGVRTVHSSHDEADLSGVGSTCEMGINLLGLMLIQGNETVEDVVAGRSVVRATFREIRPLVFLSVGSILVELAFIVWEVVLHRADGKLLLEPINLIQEQDDGGFDEPPRVADGVKKCESLLHTVDGFILEQKLVVLRDGNKKEDRCDILKAVDPFLALRPLPTNIKHAVCQLADDECSLCNASSLDTRS